MNRKWARFVIALAILTAAGAWGFSRLSQPPTAARNDGRLSVVAAENFWGDIAGQLGGGRVNVTTLISNPSADPHLYEATARNAAAVGAADVVIYNGLGYDDFMPKLLAAAPSDQRKTVSAAAASATPDGANPHIWYDMAKVKSTAEVITAALTAKDGAHAAEYQNNLRKFEIALKEVTAAQAKIAGFYGGAPVAYTERVPEYMLRDTGLSLASPAGFARAIENGSEPSPADLSAMRQLLTSKSVRVLLYNPQADSSATQEIRALAVKMRVPVVAVTETMPAGQANFQAWQLSQISQLEDALNAY